MISCVPSTGLSGNRIYQALAAALEVAPLELRPVSVGKRCFGRGVTEALIRMSDGRHYPFFTGLTSEEFDRELRELKGSFTICRSGEQWAPAYVPESGSRLWQ